MKIFWSWQSDTPGKTGRHFVRRVLEGAIEELKQPEDINEPLERDNRNALHLDHDRKGVPGSPDLAPTILRKIAEAFVFIADVSLTGSCRVEGVDDEEPRTKKFINSNVAIEYGYALHALGDDFILMVQNVHYGAREERRLTLGINQDPFNTDLYRRLLRPKSIQLVRSYEGSSLRLLGRILKAQDALPLRNSRQIHAQVTPLHFGLAMKLWRRLRVQCRDFLVEAWVKKPCIIGLTKTEHFT